MPFLVKSTNVRKIGQPQKLCRQQTLPNPGESKRKSCAPIEKDKRKEFCEPVKLEWINKTPVKLKHTNHAEENYQLTERVLQWLDLAGKNSDENYDAVPVVNRNSNKTNKRVLTANPALGSNSNSKDNNGLALVTPKRQVAVLKRTESIHRLSLTLNEDELPNPIPSARRPPNCYQFKPLSTRNIQQMSSAKSKITISSPIMNNSGGPSKVHLMSPKSTTSESSSVGGASSAPNKTTTGVKSGSSSGKKKSLGKLGKTESIENQYRSMINRQLIETSCNTQLAKRQLHIFMPNPKLGPSQSSQNDCDSCLNSIISDASKP